MKKPREINFYYIFKEDGKSFDKIIEEIFLEYLREKNHK